MHTIHSFGGLIQDGSVQIPAHAITKSEKQNELFPNAKLENSNCDDIKNDIQTNPKGAFAYVLHGKTLAQDGKWDEAKESFQTAISLDPKRADAHRVLGDVLKRQCKLDEAKESLQTALTLNPKDAAAHAVLGDVLKRQGKLDEAKESFQTALTLNPKDANAHAVLGHVLILQGKLDEAKESLQTAISLNPKDAIAHAQLGYVLMKQGKLDEAKESLQTAISLNPKDAITHTNLGSVLGNQGKLAEAKESFQTALTLNPKDKGARDGLDKILRLQGKLDKEKALPQEKTRPMSQELKRVKKQYKKAQDAEIKRLRTAGIFEKSLELQLDDILENIEKSKSNIEPKGNQKRVKVALGRALEIKKHLGTTHYVFTHAQDARWVIVTYLINELISDRYQEEKAECFKFLRIPTPKVAKVSDIQTQNVDDHITAFREELISADAYLLNHSEGESALQFLSRNYSVASQGNDEQAIIDCAFKIITHFVKNTAMATRIHNRIAKLINKIGIAAMGSFHIICIPKELTSSPETNFQFRAHPLGKPCSCSLKNRVDDHILLDLLQSDCLTEELKCDDFDTENMGGPVKKRIPQYRLLASHLKPEKGILIRTETPFTQTEKTRFKNVIRKAIS